ncbi:MAG: hypothetical protein ACXWAU_05125 [Usitatibacter sp.]
MNTRNTLLAAILAAALPVAAQTTPATGQPNPANVQVVDKASADAQAHSAKQGAKAARRRRRRRRRPSARTRKPLRSRPAEC